MAPDKEDEDDVDDNEDADGDDNDTDDETELEITEEETGTPVTEERATLGTNDDKPSNPDDVDSVLEQGNEDGDEGGEHVSGATEQGRRGEELSAKEDGTKEPVEQL